MARGMAGFAKSRTDGTYHPLLDATPGDPLEAIAMYLDVDGARLLLVAVDFAQFDRHSCNEVREGMARSLELPTEAIIFHSTHNHAGPTQEDYILSGFPLAGLTRCCTEVGRAAIAAAVPARVAYACADVGGRYSLCRRKWLNDDLATLCNWYGYRNEMPRGSSANHLIRERLDRWFGPDYPDPAWLKEPVHYDEPVDPLVQALAFEDLRGRPLGGLIRFAAHPHLSLAARDPAYTTDYCGAARRWLDRQRGGIHLFAEGPQANLAPRETVAFVREPGRANWADTPYGPDGSLVSETGSLLGSVRQMGEALARHACQALEGAEFAPLDALQVQTDWVDLPLAPDVPPDSGTAWEMRDDWGRRIDTGRRQGVPLIDMKRMTDQYNRFHWMQKMLDEWYRPTPDDISARRLPVHLQAIRLNDVLLAGLPAETGRDTTLWLRAHTAGERVVTVQQCNGDIGYVIAAQDRRGGCYECMCSLIDDHGETVLRQASLAMLRKVM